jgi:glycosyltransferase involved in cell wall biosynthesis
MGKLLDNLNMNKNLKQENLVSVGIPTYNRPNGLKRTLNCITNQTYQNIEIIISDNSSTDPGVEAVVRKFQQTYNNIQYFKQPKNQGAIFNFGFVLEQAQGKYFMWAADDDEWEPEFIEICLNYFDKESILVVPKMIVLYRGSRLTEPITLPNMTKHNSRIENLNLFLDNLAPSMIYGLFKREALVDNYESLFFDFSDCYFITKILVKGQVITLPNLEKPLYIAGVDADQYVVKIANPRTHQKLTYHIYITKQFKLLLFSSLPFINKIQLMRKVLINTCSLFLWHEKDYRHLNYKNKIKFRVIEFFIEGDQYLDNMLRKLKSNNKHRV